MKRIHILGGPGSGKSSLARREAAKLGLPQLELDAIFWDNESPAYDVRRDPAERDRLLVEHAAGEAWIIEGVYWKWCLPSFERADEIWVLDTPHVTRQWRMGLRFLRRKLGMEKSLKKDSLRGYLETARWNGRWDRDNRGPALEFLRPFESKLKFI